MGTPSDDKCVDICEWCNKTTPGWAVCKVHPCIQAFHVDQVACAPVLKIKRLCKALADAKDRCIVIRQNTDGAFHIAERVIKDCNEALEKT
jgi:hypothetical protein